MIPRFKNRLQGGSRQDKYKAVDKHVANLFKQTREKRQPVHGRTLQRWARQYAAEIGLDDFMASPH